MTLSSALTSLRDSANVHESWLQTPEPDSYPEDLNLLFGRATMQQAQTEISHWNDYQPTPLVSLSRIAQAVGIDQVWYKDESTRLGLGSFKALGGAYAVLHYLSEKLTNDSGINVSMTDVRAGHHQTTAAGVTVATATDGNHGRSVAWGAQLAGCQCKIYIHREVSPGREQAMKALGADVIRIDGDYDESVRQCDTDSEQQGWQVISDTSWDGYQDIPLQVMAGYTMMVREILDTLDQAPTHVFLQAGVGGLAAAVAASLWAELGELAPRIIVVESMHADCVLHSMRARKPASVSVEKETLMAGLSCGEMSHVAYEILSRCVSAVLTISDQQVVPTMKVMASGKAADRTIEAGECAVPGVIALLATANNSELSTHLRLSPSSRVLVFGCEGATDPQLYQQLLST